MTWTYSLPLHAQVEAPQPIALWPDTAPGSEGWTQMETEGEIFDQPVIRNVVRPSLLPYPAVPELNTGIGVIIAPGGGFQFLSIEHEGKAVAEWLNQRGINAFVLKYRTEETPAGDWGFFWQTMKLFAGAGIRNAISSPKNYPEHAFSDAEALAIDDGLQAVRLLREQAEHWKLRPEAIGILGFSAGGAVANGTALRGEDMTRPAFAASIYGVPVAGEIPANAPPLFVMAADDDPVVPPQWSRELHRRWLAAGGESELIRYETGGHGFGMRPQGLPSDKWIDAFYQWLSSRAGTL